MNEILKEQNMILQEQYYGKNKKTLEMEKVFERLKEDCTSLSGSNYIKYEKQLEKIIKELFNFKSVMVTIKDIGSINAYTYSNNLSNVSSGMLTFKEKNKKYGGIQYTDKANRAMDVTISLEIIRKEEMTPAMLTAVLLHEIGHNFFIEDSLAFIGDELLITVSSPFNSINSFKSIRNLINDRFRNTSLGKISKTIVNAINRLYGHISTLIVCFNLGVTLTNPIGVIINNVKKMIPFGNLSTYNNELFADNFATSYGYGPEVAKLANVFANNSIGVEDIDNSFKTSEFSKKLFIMYKDVLTAFNSINPIALRSNEYTRVTDQLKYLKENLKDIKNPKQKKSIEYDIKCVEATLKDFEENGSTMLKFNDVAYNVRKPERKNGNWRNLI